MADEHEIFWSKIAQKYDRIIDLQFGSPKTRSIVRERLEKSERLGYLVEFGCGTGFFTQVLAGKADRVVATDLSRGMISLAKTQVSAPNVAFQVEDCQETALPEASFDTAFMALVIHLTEPAKTLTEMRRILKPRGTLIIINVDVDALSGFDRFRGMMRIFYHGVVGYRIKPPKGFAKNALTGERLCELLRESGFEVASAETISDASRPSSIPVEYIRAVKV